MIFFFLFFRQKTSQEGDKLRSYLQSAQDHIRSLLEEKENLLEVIRTLQVITMDFSMIFKIFLVKDVLQ